MARPTSKHPTELELLILQILWAHGPQPVREVRRLLAESNPPRQLAHTSVVTTLNTMTEKRYLKRKQKLNAYIFEARITESDTQSSITSDLLARVFKGSASDMMLHLLQDKKISPAEHQHLLDLIQQHQRES